MWETTWHQIWRYSTSCSKSPDDCCLGHPTLEVPTEQGSTNANNARVRTRNRKWDSTTLESPIGSWMPLPWLLYHWLFQTLLSYCIKSLKELGNLLSLDPMFTSNRTTKMAKDERVKNGPKYIWLVVAPGPRNGHIFPAFCRSELERLLLERLQRFLFFCCGSNQCMIPHHMIPNAEYIFVDHKWSMNGVFHTHHSVIVILKEKHTSNRRHRSRRSFQARSCKRYAAYALAARPPCNVTWCCWTNGWLLGKITSTIIVW